MMTDLTRFQEAAAHYRAYRSEILEAGRSEWGVDPYEWECFSRMTPIEADLWAEIRNVDAVFYPQYPIGRFFADFCNPVAGVVIECDGAAWHQDKDKDARRQAFIESEGYKVYRIRGRDCKDQVIAREFITQIVQRHSLIRGATSWCVAWDAEANKLVALTFEDMKNLNAAALMDKVPGLALVRANYSAKEAADVALALSNVIKRRIKGDLT